MTISCGIILHMEECGWYSVKTELAIMSDYGYCRIISDATDCGGDIGCCICDEERLAENKLYWKDILGGH